VHVEKLELNDTWKILLYRGKDLVDEIMCMINNYSEQDEVAVSSFVCEAQRAVCQLLITRYVYI
jgi:hypothetical protein